MNRRTFATSLALLTALGVSGCKGFSSSVKGIFSKKSDVGLVKVDDLVSHVEAIHVEAELSKEKAHAALDMLHILIKADFQGDPVEAYASFVEAVEATEEQYERFSSTLEPMEEAADEVFDKWNQDLDSFTTQQLRQRSRARLEDTRSRYEVVMKAAEGFATSYERFNQGLRDHATFLGHDFNAASVSEIQGSVRALTEYSVEFDKRAAGTQAAAEAYVRSTSLPGTVEVTTETPKKN